MESAASEQLYYGFQGSFKKERRMAKRCHTQIFFHPDYTVGAGISPDSGMHTPP
jgi:hypothetical protein